MKSGRANSTGDNLRPQGHTGAQAGCEEPNARRVQWHLRTAPTTALGETTPNKGGRQSPPPPQASNARRPMSPNRRRYNRPEGQGTAAQWRSRSRGPQRAACLSCALHRGRGAAPHDRRTAGEGIPGRLAQPGSPTPRPSPVWESHTAGKRRRDGEEEAETRRDAYFFLALSGGGRLPL